MRCWVLLTVTSDCVSAQWTYCRIKSIYFNEWLYIVLDIGLPILVRIMPKMIQLRESTKIQIKEPRQLHKEPAIKILRRPIKSAKNEMTMQLTAEITRIMNWELLLSTDRSQERLKVYAMLCISKFSHVLSLENWMQPWICQIYVSRDLI